MRRSEERKSAEERGSTQSERNSWRIRESDTGRNSSDVRESSVAKLPSTNDIFVAAGCLKGEECYEKPKAIHRLFEEMLMTNSSHDLTALIYGGKKLICLIKIYANLSIMQTKEFLRVKQNMAS